MKFILAFVAGAVAALAVAKGAGEGTDIIPRIVNFAIFATILWLLLAKVIRNYFEGRAEAIADQLNRVQEKLNESREAKESAQKRVEDAKVFADELASSTFKEKEILAKQIAEANESDLIQLQKQADEKKELLQRQMIGEVVEDVMAEVLEESTQSLDKQKMAEIVMRKVA